MEAFALGDWDDPETEKERETFAALCPELSEKYMGEYVAVYESELVDHDELLRELLKRINRNYPDRFVLVRQVANDPEPVYQFRSPRWLPN